MFRVRVERLLEADIHRVFEALTNHAGYAEFPGCSKAELLEEGSTEKNGLGAVRRLHLGSVVVFVERIERFEAPTCFEYKITSSKPFPMDHQLGRVSLSDEGGKTRVIWVSEGHVSIPLIGSLLDRVVEQRAREVFSAGLKAVERSLR